MNKNNKVDIEEIKKKLLNTIVAFSSTHLPLPPPRSVLLSLFAFSLFTQHLPPFHYRSPSLPLTPLPAARSIFPSFPTPTFPLSSIRR
ncbi:hypothetical protein, partial [Mesomycoplasma hyorhinis]|uniref:hypothetical protein n=1 Tax=Mesomycoplasma hyorhinis TaxID=2100 RepID=UPI001C05BDE4